MNTPTKTVLICGTDLVGKTTLVKELFISLKEQNKNVEVNKFDLHKTQLMSYALDLMDDTWEERKLVINGLLFLSFLVDSLMFTAPKNTIFIQDSYIERTLAYCHAYDVPYLDKIFDSYKDRLIRFDITIHLKADIETRRNRLLAMGNRDFFDDLVFKNPEKLHCMDQYLEKIVSNEPNYKVINTAKLSIPEVRDLALKHITALL